MRTLHYLCVNGYNINIKIYRGETEYMSYSMFCGWKMVENGGRMLFQSSHAVSIKPNFTMIWQGLNPLMRYSTDVACSVVEVTFSESQHL